MGNGAPQSYEFGEYRFDADDQALARGHSRIPLQPTTFRTLQTLIAHAGRLVTRETLVHEVWGDTSVGENSLAHQISLLRKALDDDGSEARYIETVPRRGYRFVAAVKQIRKDGVSQPAWRRHARAVFSIALGLCAFAALVALGVRYSGAGSPAHSVTSLAVLPFAADESSGEDDGSIAFGLSDALITRLTSLQNIVVRPLADVRRYAGQPHDTVAAARALQVDAVLDGTIRRIGDRLTVQLRLVEAGTATTLWTGTFDESLAGLFTIDDEIAEQVVRTLAVDVSAAERVRLAARFTRDPAAAELYAKARVFLGRRTDDGLRKAIQYFEQAIGRDPAYALAYAGLADAWALLGQGAFVAPTEAVTHTTAAARRAVELDERLPEAHVSLAVAHYLNRHWPEAEREFRTAIALNPNLGQAHQWYASYYLVPQGRSQDAIRELTRAHELDPVSVVVESNLGSALYYARRPREALVHFRQALELDPAFWPSHYSLGMAYNLLGDPLQAINELEQAERASPTSAMTLGPLGHAYALAGRPNDARRVIDRLKPVADQTHRGCYEIAMVHAGLGEHDATITWLEEAYRDGSFLMVWMNVEPQFDPLRRDPRFVALLHRLGLPGA